MNKSGIQDLMDKQRFKPQHIQKALIENDAPGNWASIQNVYNLVKGNTTPKDPYAYLVLSRLLNVDVEVILMRYTDVKNKVKAAIEKQDVDTDSVDWSW
jgi:hypothetical protein